MANPPHSTSQEPVVSEKEWNDGFSFLQNEVHAIYTNVVSRGMDSSARAASVAHQRHSALL